METVTKGLSQPGVVECNREIKDGNNVEGDELQCNQYVDRLRLLQGTYLSINRESLSDH